MNLKEKLVQSAYQYKATKLRTKLWDEDMFAVKMSDGNIGYITVLGHAGEYNALAMCVGEDGGQSIIKYRFITGLD